MASKLLSRTREQTTTTGTGDITVSGVVSSNTLKFSDSMSVGDITFVTILSGNLIDWEECFATYSAVNTIQRGTVVRNSAGTTSHVNLTGTSRVFASIPPDLSKLFDLLFGNTDGTILTRVSGAWIAAFPASAGTVTNVATGTGLTGGPITNTGTLAVDTSVIATKAYVDNSLQNFDLKDPVLAATTGSLPFTPTYNNGSSGIGATLTASAGILIIDGYTPVIGDRLLIKNQATVANNGIYTITTVGTSLVGYVLTRATDFNNASNIVYGDTALVLNGTVNQNQQFTMSNNAAIIVGATSITFAQTSGGSQLTSGAGITITGNNVALAQMAAHTFKGNNTGATANPIDLTATQLTAELNSVVGDSGSGGTAGLVPAAAAGSAAANFFLGAGGSFSAPYISGWHYPVSFATTATLAANTYNNGTSGFGATLTGNSNGALAAIDDISPVVGYRLLVKNEATAANNGIYVVTQIGDGSHPYILTRSTDFNSPNNINQGDIVAVGPNGTLNSSRIFMVTASASSIVIGTTGLTFSRVTVGDKYIIGASVSGLLTAGQILLMHRCSTGITIPSNFNDHLGYRSQAGGTNNAVGSTVINVDKALNGNLGTFTTYGTITIAAGTVNPTFATTGGTPISFARSDVLRLIGPSPADANFGGFFATIVASET